MPGDYMERLVEAFTDLLRREGRTSLTDGEMALRIGRRVGRVITSQVAGRWVAGKVRPRSDAEKKAFAEVLGVQAGWLFWNEGAKHGAEESIYLGPVPHDEAEAASRERAAKLAAQREGATPAEAPDPPARNVAGGRRRRDNPTDGR